MNMQTPQIDPADADNNVAMGILAYIIFFIPLLAARDSKFAMYHANQGFVLFLSAVILNVAANIIGRLLLPFYAWYYLIDLVNLAVFVMAIIGIVNAAQKKTVPLPIIGQYQLIK